MGRSWTIEVGHSTRALDRHDVDRAVTAALAAGGNIVELSALDEADLDPVLAASRGFARRAFRRLSIHAPARGRQLPESELVGRLACAGVPVVVHPEVIGDPEPWRLLGRRLLVENTDGRTTGRPSTPSDLVEIFAELPDAGFCLDVSHALHAGGLEVVDELAVVLAPRLDQLHAGCGCGCDAEERLGDDVLRALMRVLPRAGRPLPIIIERPCSSAAAAMAQVYAVRAALVASVPARDAA